MKIEKSKKNSEIRLRIEKDVKRNYLLFCKKNNTILSKRIRDLILLDLKNE